MNNKVVVYLDGSFYEKSKTNCIGVGVYIIHEDKTDVKISKGFSSTKMTRSLLAEMESLKVFLKYIEENEEEYKDKEFYFYCDCEYLVNVLNNKSRNAGSIQFKKHLFQQLDSLNIKGAYWVKGHEKEPGNLVVDVLAHNGMKFSRYTNQEITQIALNTSLLNMELFNGRYPEPIKDAEDIGELNKICFERIYQEDKNHKSKSESNHLLDKILLIENDKEYVANISGTTDTFKLNNHVLHEATFEKALSLISRDVSILREMKRLKPVSIYIEDKNFFNLLKEKYLMAESLNKRREDEFSDKILYKQDMILFMSDKINKAMHVFIKQKIKLDILEIKPLSQIKSKLKIKSF